MADLGIGFVGEVHFFVFIFAGLLGIGAAIWGMANLEKQATVEFAVFSGASSIWVFLVATQIVAGIEHQYTLMLISSIFQIITVGAWFWFTLTYTGYREQLSIGIWVAYGLLTALVVGIIVTDPWFGFAFEEPIDMTDPFEITTWSHGTLGQLLLLYTYGSFITGTVVLMYRFHTTGYAKTWQAPFLLYLNVQLIAIDNLYGFLTIAYEPVNYIALAAPLTAGLYYITLYRHDVLGFAPVARQAIFAEMNDAAFVLNPRGNVVDYNHKAMELITTDTDEIVGKPAEDILPEPIISDGIKADSIGGEAVNIQKGDETRYYDVSVSDVSTSKGTAGTILTLRDVTQAMEQKFKLEEQKEELTQQKDELERQNERLDKFAGTLAHDLRNPLTVAHTYAEAAKGGNEEYLSESIDALDRMDNMIGEILTLARQGAAVEQPEELSLEQIAKESFAYADTEEATLNVEGDITFEGDPQRLDNLFGNLFRNASDHGPEDVRIYVEPLNDDNGFAIEDTGPGIPKSDWDDIFDHGFTTNEEGTGFGLSIVKEIANAHGWSVDIAEGEREGGARFEFYF